ncbi:MAG: DUF6249 domain-containing protein [Vicinamibacterales bacterium]
MEDVLIPIVGMLIPLSAIVLGIGIAFWYIYWDHQKKRLQYQERQLMIEKGLTPPPVLPDQPRKKVTPEDCLRRGTVLLFLGIGFGAAALVVINAWPEEAELGGMLGVTGAIVGFLGLGYLVYYFIARRKTHDPGSIPMPT